MKRKLLAIVTCLAMLMSLLPIGIQPAQAANNFEIIVGGERLSANVLEPVYATTNDNGKVTTNGANEKNWNIKWDGLWLYLRNAKITSAVISEADHVSACVYANTGYTIQLEGYNELYPVNTEMTTEKYNGYAYNYGIYAKDGDLNINGVEATSQLKYDITHASALVAGPGGPSDSQRVLNAAVYVENGDFNIQSCTLNLTGGKSSVHKDATIPSLISLESYGIYVDGSMNIRSGTVIANGGETVNNSPNTPFTSQVSAGIYTEEDVNINGGAITAGTIMSGEGNSFGGFLVNGNINITSNQRHAITYSIGSSASSIDTTKTVTNNDGTHSLDTHSVKYFHCETSDYIAVDSVELNETVLNLNDGEEHQLEAKISPDNATVQTVSWSSNNPNVATVDANGKITAKGSGTATITATVDGKTADCQVTVSTPVTGVTLDKAEMLLATGETGTLNATVEPYNASNKEVDWSSDKPEVATVNDGLVIAKGPGTATITVTTEDGNKTASCTVTVTQLVTGLKLDKNTLTLATGETGTLNATVEPDNASNEKVDWSSSDPEVATVKDGLVTAVGPGTATITATATDGSGVEASCAVTVSQPVTGITLDQESLTLTLFSTHTFTARVQPENASDKSLEWTSSNESVAKVDENGVVTAIKAGEATITAKAKDGSGVEASCQVTVPPQLVSAIKLDEEDITLTQGETASLTADIRPVAATNGEVEWSSSDENVATVEHVKTESTLFDLKHEGKITAVGPGTTTITVTAKDGSGITATCKVTVYEKSTITTQPQDAEVTEGESVIFSAEASGSEPLTYQWQERTDDGQTWTDIDGATNATYTIDCTTTDMSGYQYRCIVTGLGGEAISNAATLTVNERPYTGKYSYEILNDVGENGTIEVDRYATEGDQVTITVSPDEAYLLDDLTVTSGGKDVELTDNGDGTYSFTMPSGDVAITATFAEDPNWEEPEDPATDVSEIFTDVPANHWAQAAIQYVYDNGLMTGVSDTAFAPEATTTRAMIVSMLARLENVTSAESAGFSDVSGSDWYADAVNWAASEGIVGGFGDGSFQPNAPITREQMASILYRYAEYKGYDVSARADLSAYSDQPSVWAEDVMQWAVAEGLLNGVTDDKLQPQGQATRAQVAAILQRFLSE